jgi:hypothetical protein
MGRGGQRAEGRIYSLLDVFCNVLVQSVSLVLLGRWGN